MQQSDKETRGGDVPDLGPSEASDSTPIPASGVDEPAAETYNPEHRAEETCPPQFPKSLSTAGTVWIVVGSLVSLGAAMGLVMVLAGNAAPSQRYSNVGPAVPIFGAFITMLIGGAFVYVGVSSVWGTAADTLGNSIGSMIIGAIWFYQAVQALLQAGDTQTVAQTIQVFSLFFLATVMLVAGFIAFGVREDYLRWRKVTLGKVPSTESPAGLSAPPAALSFLDSQFVRMSPAGFWLLILCLPFIAIPLGGLGFIACRHLPAKKRAGQMAVAAGLWLVLFPLFLYMASR